MKNRAFGKLMLAGAFATMMSLAVLTANADMITLSDSNASVFIDTQDGDGSPVGVQAFVVDGVDHLHEQWFWYRIGQTTAEAPIHTLNQVGITASDTNFDPGLDTLNVTYADPAGAFRISITYTLEGGLAGSGVATLAEGIRIENLTSQALDFHFFQYSDFDLAGDSSNDTVVITNNNTAVQSKPSGTLTETVVTTAADRIQADVFSVLRDSLNDAGTTTLNNVASFGPGDATWAFQWDRLLAPEGLPGSDLVISKLKRVEIIPEPTTLSILGLAGLAALRRRREA